MAQVESVRRLQQRFKGHLLRRTIDSVNWCGQTLLNLPPHVDLVGILRLTKRESDILDERAEAAKGRYAPSSNLRCYVFLTSLSSIISANESGKFMTKVSSHQPFYAI
jgi:hypothetical protein